MNEIHIKMGRASFGATRRAFLRSARGESVNSSSLARRSFWSGSRSSAMSSVWTVAPTAVTVSFASRNISTAFLT